MDLVDNSRDFGLIDHDHCELLVVERINLRCNLIIFADPFNR